MVTSGDYYNGGCCFDYGNAETNSMDNGEGTMEAVYFGNLHHLEQGGWRRSVGHGGPRKRSLGRRRKPLRKQHAGHLQVRHGHGEG